MGINGIGDYNAYSARWQELRTPVIPGVSVEEVKRQEEQKVSKTAVSVNQPDARAPLPGQSSFRSNAELEDISLTFNRQEDFAYIGQDSDIRSLDMEKAISDMKKDQVLQQYQYFVGSSRELLAESADGSVFVKF